MQIRNILSLLFDLLLFAITYFSFSLVLYSAFLFTRSFIHLLSNFVFHFLKVRNDPETLLGLVFCFASFISRLRKIYEECEHFSNFFLDKFLCGFPGTVRWSLCVWLATRAGKLPRNILHNID